MLHRFPHGRVCQFSLGFVHISLLTEMVACVLPLWTPLSAMYYYPRNR
jgi:hypothetical protein